MSEPREFGDAVAAFPGQAERRIAVVYERASGYIVRVVDRWNRSVPGFESSPHFRDEQSAAAAGAHYASVTGLPVDHSVAKFDRNELIRAWVERLQSVASRPWAMPEHPDGAA